MELARAATTAVELHLVRAAPCSSHGGRQMSGWSWGSRRLMPFGGWGTQGCSDQRGTRWRGHIGGDPLSLQFTRRMREHPKPSSPMRFPSLLPLLQHRRRRQWPCQRKGARSANDMIHGLPALRSFAAGLPCTPLTSIGSQSSLAASSESGGGLGTTGEVGSNAAGTTLWAAFSIFRTGAANGVVWKDLVMPRGGWIGSLQISETNTVVKTLVGTTDVVPELLRGLGTSGTRSVLPTRQRRLKRNLKSTVILAILFEPKS
jgi:hypothetical protein